MGDCPGTFRTETEAELCRHVEVHGALAHGEQPENWSKEERRRIRRSRPPRLTRSGWATFVREGRYGVRQRPTSTEIHLSARRHGVADGDLVHAIEHALAVEDVGEDLDRWLVIGPNTTGNLLEVVVLTSSKGDQLVINAMAMRPGYRRLLER